MPKLTTRAFVRYWIPAICWMIVIAVESTAIFSAANTGGIVDPILHWLLPSLSFDQIEHLHHLGRKVGHFTGYGLMSYFFFRAIRGTYHVHQGTEDILRHRIAPAGQTIFQYFWNLRWAALAIFATFLVATADEAHQMTLPSRTGTWRDVLLDTIGAVIIQFVVFALIRTRRSHKNAVVETVGRT